MSISFNEIPINVRVSGVYIEIDNSLANNAEDLQKVLIVGESNGGDTAINTIVPIVTPDLAMERFGQDSMIHKMATAFYNQNIALPMYGVAVDSITPDVDAALAATGDNQFHHTVLGLNDSVSVMALGEFLSDRYTALQQIPGLGYVAKKDTFTNLLAYGESYNSPFIEVFGVNSLVDKESTAYSEPELAAAWAGQVAPSLAIDPCRPLQTLELKKVYTDADIEFGFSERNLLLYSGISTYKTNDAKQVFIDRAITTYKENAAGVADDSYLDITVPATAMFYRAKQRSRILSKFPRHKLAKDGTKFAPGQAVVTPSIIKAELLSLYKELEYRGIVQDFEGYKSSLIVELDPDNPKRVNELDSPQFVNGLVIYAGKIQYRL